ncbi:lysylphosphatidylglycerol synthase domain-containing protein [Pseudactinotalea terrae]|uniref:lysylphosphatidylglycerol synthase domain-containing protein n=1 Tax=Pseudactinotalea terrae TaxID=1743262 RepID=UPI0012E23827|nr:lysylphosphatidylglycerol synthase domain-containing protein [Pseudactinotalea terrae]
MVRPTSLGRRLLRWAIALAVAIFAWFALQRLIGRVDWSAVWGALSGLAGWVVLPLLLALVLRQLLNSVPLTYYVPGLTLGKSMLSDTTANLVGTFAPPPSDLVVRISMFRSWRLDPAAGVTGGALNTAKFYAIRFLAPPLGLLLLGVHEAERRQWLLALACVVVAAVLLGGLVLLLRSDEIAGWLGRTAGSVVRRFRKDVDPRAWADSLVDLRARSADSLRRGLLPSMLALVGMVLADATILVLSARGVGIPAGTLTALEIIPALLILYPLTLLPLFGLGVLDAVLVGSLTTMAGLAYEADVVAAVVIWRFTTILGTLALGLVTLGWWRLTTRNVDDEGDPAVTPSGEERRTP